MVNPFSKSKTAANVALLEGFKEEFQKIAAGAATVSEMTKTIKPPTAKPKLTSRPIQKEIQTPHGTLDPLRSSRTIEPPPVTAAGA